MNSRPRNAWGAALTAVWAGFVLFLYLRHHDVGVALLRIGFLVKEIFEQARPNPFLLETLSASLCILFLSASLLIVGRKIIKGLDEDFPGELIPGLAITLGLGVLSSLTALILFLHVVYSWISWCIYGLTITAAIACLVFKSEPSDFGILSELGTVNKIILAALAAFLYLGTLFPEITYDPLVYHLTYPSLYHLNHGFVANPFSFFASFPQTVEMLYLFGISLGNEMFSKTFQFVMAAAVALTLLGAARKAQLEKNMGTLAVLLFFSAPMTAINVWTCLVDIATALFGWCSLIVMAEAAEKFETKPDRSFRLAILAGLLCGWAMGTKYTAFPLILLIPLIAFSRLRRNPNRHQISPTSHRILLAFVLSAALTVSPWLIRNLLVNHNPIYPFFGTVWGTPPIETDGWKRILSDANAHHPAEWISNPSILLHTLLQPLDWLALNRATGMGDDTGPAFLFCLGGLFLMFFMKDRGGRQESRTVLHFAKWYACGGGILWILTGGVPRYTMIYFAPVFLIWADLSAFEKFRPKADSLIRIAVLSILAVSYIYSASNLQVMEARRVLWGGVEKETFLSSRHELYPAPPFAAYRHLNQTRPKNAGVMIIGEARGYYLERPFIIGSVFDPPPIVMLSKESENGEDLYRRLLKENVRYIVMNAMEASRTQSYYVFPWDKHSFQVFQEFWTHHAKSEAHFISESDGTVLFVYEIVEKTAETAQIPAVILRNGIQ